MKNNWRWLAAILLIGCSYAFTTSDKSWQKTSAGIDESDIRCVVVHPENHQYIFVGTSRALYRSMDYGQHYSAVLQLRGSAKAVNSIYVSSGSPSNIFVATDDGLFLSPNNGEEWNKIYESENPQSQRCWAVAADEKDIYLGTAKGLFYKSMDGHLWNRAVGDLSDLSVYKLAQDRTNVYVATESGLYRFNIKERTAERIFNLGRHEVDEIGEDLENVQEREVRGIQSVKDILVTEDAEPLIYLATEEGIFCSENQGNSWERLFTDGLPVRNLSSMTIFSKGDTSHGDKTGSVVSDQSAEDKICQTEMNARAVWAGTQDGVYRQSGNGWEALYKGMETKHVQSLAADKSGNIFAGTDQGVFRWGGWFLGNSKQGTLDHATAGKQDFFQEPAIHDVQRWAVDYAEVNPEKIRKWRSAAGRKAILPTLSIGLNRADAELMHWDSGPNPDNLLKGRDYMDWDVAVKWELGDLIWNSDQTSIDSRSKLMVELRQDVLDQVTRLYFERRRVQMELAKVSEHQQFVDKQMRVDELTALIDGFTGGRFGKKLIMSDTLSVDSDL